MALDSNKPMPDDRYGQLPEKIVNTLKDYEYKYFREDKPIPFCGLSIYPIQVRDYESFSSCCDCFSLNRKESVQGLRMNDLEFLVSKMKIKESDEGRIWSYKVQKMFELIFHVDNGLKCKKCGHVIKYTDQTFADYVKNVQEAIQKANKDNPIDPPQLTCPEEGCGSTEFIEMIKISVDPTTKKPMFVIDGHEIKADDFSLLRQVVLFQNFPDYADDSWIDPEVKKDHDEKMKIEQQKNDLHATIEKKVVCLSISTHYKFDEIYDMPIRKFTMALSTVDDLINYKIMKQATMSGFVSLPKGKSIEHWIYKPNKDMYGDSYKDADDVKSSVNNL